MQSSPIIRPRPARWSRVSTLRSNSRIGCAAPGARIGLPRVTMPSTRSGRRPASPRAIRPPRLCPTIVTLRAALGGDLLDALLEHLGGLAGAADVRVHRGAVGAVAQAAQVAGHQREAAVAGHEPGHQHHRLQAGLRDAQRVGRVAAVQPVVGAAPDEPGGLGHRAALARDARAGRDGPAKPGRARGKSPAVTPPCDGSHFVPGVCGPAPEIWPNGQVDILVSTVHSTKGPDVLPLVAGLARAPDGASPEQQRRPPERPRALLPDVR